jgi:hypothetical protein
VNHDQIKIFYLPVMIILKFVSLWTQFIQGHTWIEFLYHDKLFRHYVAPKIPVTRNTTPKITLISKLKSYLNNNVFSFDTKNKYRDSYCTHDWCLS